MTRLDWVRTPCGGEGPLWWELREISAPPELLGWVGGRDLATAWAECPRADLLLWLAARAGATLADVAAAGLALSARPEDSRAWLASGERRSDEMAAVAAWAESVAQGAEMAESVGRAWDPSRVSAAAGLVRATVPQPPGPLRALAYFRPDPDWPQYGDDPGYWAGY